METTSYASKLEKKLISEFKDLFYEKINLNMSDAYVMEDVCVRF